MFRVLCLRLIRSASRKAATLCSRDRGRGEYQAKAKSIYHVTRTFEGKFGTPNLLIWIAVCSQCKVLLTRKVNQLDGN